MSKGETAENVFRALFKELGVKVTEEQGEGALAFKSEECKFKLNVQRGEDGNFDKTVLENSEGEERSKKFEAVVDALTVLLKAFPRGDKPKDEEKSEETKEEAKKSDGSEANGGDGKAEEATSAADE
ncbi:Hypothetical predicted protein [Paramuricea clavata]|uniref:Uncharacterized protein n=1 Tax=Paramuricea clavata TaxID=317549 RepID=A0A7D9HTG8_PARCT|nr:Hypothetical predicted protein [Paramuricea clavata]